MNARHRTRRRFAVPAALAAAALPAAATPQSPAHLARPDPFLQASARPRPPDPRDPRLIEHRRLVIEGARASREYRPPPPAWPRPDNGIIELQPGASPPGPAPAPGAAAAKTKPAPYCPKTFKPYPGTSPVQKTLGFYKAFPEVAWMVCVNDMGMKGLWISSVWLKRTPTSDWLAVIAQAGPAEIFVPYHNGLFRPFDLHSVPYLSQVTTQDAGPGGWVHTLSNEPVPTVVSELRQRGVGWMCKGGDGRAPNTMMVHRASEMAIWGVAEGGNYDNIIEYSFRDDGGMTFRIGNTGFTSSNWPSEPHSHIALWYVDMNLGGASNFPLWLEHLEPFPLNAPDKAADGAVHFAVEGARRWDSEKYTSLLVQGVGTNIYGAPIGYAFTPVLDGFARTFGWGENWTQNDVYITRRRSTEMGWTKNHLIPDAYLLTYVNGENVEHEDLVAWIKTSTHHVPLSEDRSWDDVQTGGDSGLTMTHWHGFRIDPFNLFDTNPLGGPVRC